MDSQFPDLDSYLKASYVAHRTVCEASGNPFITRLVFLLAHQTLRYARLGLSTVKRRQQSAKNWRRMLAAIQGGDGEDAQAAAEQLARESRDAAVKLLTESQRRDDPEPAPAPAPQPRRATKRS
ncbi:MAG: FCD domain-containing protein [Burkholderiaceae bacterium]